MTLYRSQNGPLPTSVRRAAIDVHSSSEDALHAPFGATRGEPLHRLRAIAHALEQEARSENTRRAYRSAFGSFRRWCEQYDLEALPSSPETLVLYAAHLSQSGRSMATIESALVAISQTHFDHDYPSPRVAPNVRRVVRGLRRTLSVRPDSKRPILEEHLHAIVATAPEGLLAIRDRAVLLVGFATGLRRSELVAIRSEHVSISESGIRIFVPRSKTDQVGRGRSLFMERRADALCPREALHHWTSRARIEKGPVFRSLRKGERVTDDALSGKAIERIVKAAAQSIGLDAAEFAAHSLRSGYATAAAARGVPEHLVMRQLDHTSTEMTRRYVRDANSFR